MKNRIKVALFTALSVVTAAAAVSATFAWFFASVKLPDYDYLAQSAGAYFESGNGSFESPFIISRPRHMYNLAWLQDMGAFNRQEVDEDGYGVVVDGKPKIKQYYFKIKPTLQDVGLDMNGLVIPPIGTEQYPFLGNFDGSGAVISNFTVSNSFSDYANHPRIVSNFIESDDGVNQPRVIGFFGVVGEKGEGNYSYSPGVNQLNNFALDDFEVKSMTDTVLTGLAIGYLNGATSNVAVKSGDLTIGAANTNYLDADLTDNLSDYSVIGYATDDYKTTYRKYQQTVFGADVENSEFTANDEGNTTGGGGSVNMTDLYHRLVNIYNNGSNYSNTNPFYYNYTNQYSADWSTITSTSHDDEDYMTTHLRYNHSDEYMGNFEFLTRGDSSTTFMYLAGGHYEDASFYDNFYRINDGEGHFMTCVSVANNASVSNTNTENDAIVWAVPANDTGHIYTMYAGDPYYLKANGTSLILTNDINSATTWTKELNDDDKIRYSYNGSSIVYDEGNDIWKLATIPDPTRPDDPIVYLPDVEERDTPPDPISVPEPGVVAETGTRQISYTSNGTTYYIHPNNARTGFEGKTTLYNPGWTFTPTASQSTISTVISGTTYYVNFSTNNNTFGLSTSSTQCKFKSGYQIYYTVDGGLCGSDTDYYLAASGTTISTARSGTNFDCPNNATYKGTFMLYADAQAIYEAEKAAYDPEKERYDEEYAAYYGWLEYYDYRDNTFPGLWEDYQTAISGYANTYNIVLNNITPEHPWSGASTYLNGDKAKAGMSYTKDDTTYMPLNVIKDGNKKESFADYRPLNSNTGYIVAGAEYGATDSGASLAKTAINNGPNPNLNSDSSTTYRATPASRMRISQYAISGNISGSYDNTNKKLTTVYTVDQNLNITTNPSSLYENYNKNANKLVNVLKEDNTNVYGLHFMNSFISMDALVEAKQTKIGSVDYAQNYQLPVNSIDFKLLEKGYVNFFAGMYFNGNNSFFSLHQIRRNDDSTIREIKEIAEVYSDGIDNHSYIYKYTDGKYSKPFQYEPTGGKIDFDGQAFDNKSFSETQLPTSYLDTNGVRHTCTYQPVFNIERITNVRNGSVINSNLNKNNHGTHIFYFEIPMNEGEFALGSVNGGVGGYLFYLDIGANAKKVNRTSYLQHFKTTLEVTSYPHGVAFEDISVGSTISVTSGDGAFVAVLPLYSDTLSLTRVDDGVYIQDGYNDTYVKGRYEQTGITMYSGAPPDTSNEIDVEVDQTITEIWRLETYEFNNANQSITRSIIDVTYIDGVLQDRIASQYYNGTLVFDSTSEDPDLSNEENAKFYVAADGIGQSRSYTEIVVAESGTIVNTVIGTIVVDGDNITVDGFTIDLSASKGASEIYFTATGYTITIENPIGNPTVTATPGTSLPTGYTSITIVVDGYVVTISGMNVTVE